ncbi:M1 family metallopeptidase, partial [Flavobacteriaceae bacterium]|nr:M1 family metallopeptidase [Flavobacteriaceae bacterium]
MKKLLILSLISLNLFSCKTSKNVNDEDTSVKTKSTYWQQHVDYQMDIDMDVNNYQYKGKQKLVYTNNSPDELYKVYYHLYFNAFQPGSEMDALLQSVPDPDGRMTTNTGTKENPIIVSRIKNLQANEIGFIKVNSLTLNGKSVAHKTVGTVLEVVLNKSIKPGEKVTFEMDFLGQVPLQIRRSGRNNKEGVALSMSQWFPKMAEYDFEGWHADAYVAREFHGVWGNFDVKLTIDKNYTVGGSGYLQNPNEIGHGYQDEGIVVPKTTEEKLTWHFVAPNVHDFTWAADPNYIHDKIKGENGVDLHFIYKNDESIKENWKKLQPKTAELLAFFNKNVGPYPWKQYSVIQGGDGGMEYAMCTLITGQRKLGSLIGVTAHEMAHAWFQHLFATNETKHEWMDEGMTSYISALAMAKENENPFEGAYRNYNYLVSSGKEEPQTTYADRYHSNMAYGIAAYSKGEIFLSQLGYIIGKDKLDETLKEYYKKWGFKHPTPNDFKRVAEKVSGFELDWYLTEWTQTTKTIDYAIKNVTGNKVTLERKGSIPMPIDLIIEYTDGSKEYIYIPLQMARAEKENAYPKLTRIIKKDW